MNLIYSEILYCASLSLYYHRVLPSMPAIHWPEHDGSLEPFHPWLMDVAKMQNIFYTKTNTYAAGRNFDYADRIVRTGSHIVELALTVCHQQAAPPHDKNRFRGSINGHINQSIHDAQDRIRIPHGRYDEYQENGGTDNVPAELSTLFQGTWSQFRDEHQLDLPDLNMHSHD